MVAMRLLNTKTGQFVEKDPEKTRYAILSHTWDKEGKGEQTYQEVRDVQEMLDKQGCSQPSELPSASGTETSCRPPGKSAAVKQFFLRLPSHFVAHRVSHIGTGHTRSASEHSQ